VNSLAAGTRGSRALDLKASIRCVAGVERRTRRRRKETSGAASVPRGPPTRGTRAAGLSREDLTLQLGLSSPYRIRQWEMGFERPQPRFVPPLAATLKIDPLHLLDVDPADPPLAALRVAAGLSIAHVGTSTMSLMTFQRLEDGRPGAAPRPRSSRP